MLSFAFRAVQSAARGPLLTCRVHLSSLSQTLPKIDLNSYSVVPVDEGDEDRDIDSDDDAAGSDLDLDLGDGDSEEGLAHMTERITCDMSDMSWWSFAELLWHQSSPVSWESCSDFPAPVPSTGTSLCQLFSWF